MTHFCAGFGFKFVSFFSNGAVSERTPEKWCRRLTLKKQLKHGATVQRSKIKKIFLKKPF